MSICAFCVCARSSMFSARARSSASCACICCACAISSMLRVCSGMEQGMARSGARRAGTKKGCTEEEECMGQRKESRAHAAEIAANKRGRAARAGGEGE